MREPYASERWVQGGNDYMRLPDPATEGSQVNSQGIMINALEAHTSAEEKTLERYRLLIAESGDPEIALIMGLVLQDEENHHALMKRILVSMTESPYWKAQALPLPQPAHPRRPSQQVLDALRDCLQDERTGISHMKALARQHANSKNALTSILLEMMALDSQKHERLLHFLTEGLESRVS